MEGIHRPVRHVFTHLTPQDEFGGSVATNVRVAFATYASRGLRVNRAAPGLVETPLTGGLQRRSEHDPLALRDHDAPRPLHGDGE
jgi:NAD(P)-dependent dehydrogenase (short-subunit alcohol dehydrogenase family)